MDGTTPPRPHLSRRRLLATLGALVAIATGTGSALAADQPGDPSARWPADGAAVRTAMELAAQHWGLTPCRGRVQVAWEELDRGINGQSSWTNPVDPYRQPSRNADCEIGLSVGGDWDWAKLCTVIVHEVGHLTGHDHVADPQDLMFWTYLRPIPECADAPEPAGAAAAPSAAPLAAPAVAPVAPVAPAASLRRAVARASRPKAKKPVRRASPARGAKARGTER